MATYDYHCKECKDTIEVVRDINAPAEDVVCASCGGLRVKKFTSPPVTINDKYGGPRYIK